MFQDESWSENNSEGSSSGNKDINDINSDIDTNNQRRIEGCCKIQDGALCDNSNSFQPLTIIAKCSIMDVAAALDPPLIIAM